MLHYSLFLMVRRILLRYNHHHSPFVSEVGPIVRTTCISVIKQCGNLNTLKSIHASMLRSHLHLNLYLTTNIISQYASLGSISHAYTLFSLSQSSDLFLWNVMIQVSVENGLYERSVLLYHQMRELGIEPDNFTFPLVLKACGYLRDVELGRKIHCNVVVYGYKSDTFVLNSLITKYGKCEQVDISRQLFDEMPNRTVVSWSAMIGAYAHNLRAKEGLSIFDRMLDLAIVPSRSAILNVTHCLQTESEANEIFRIIEENGLDSDQTVKSATIVMYSRCGRVDISRKIFDGIINKDLVSWSSMMEAYAQSNSPLEAFGLFGQMKMQGVSIDFVAVLSAIRACSNLASFRQARFVHGYINRSLLLFKNEVMMATALIDLYIKCGSIDYARKVFDLMKDRNAVSWSTMIGGYGIHGRGRDALELFDQMKISMKPDGFTFVAVLSACSHSGLIAEGWTIFNSMTKDFEIIPSSEHYACMVDLMGRAGRLNEALEFINTMPIKPVSGVWGALLGACRIHSNLELAELTAKNLFELDAKNSGRYVLLCNIYNSSGKKEEAQGVRALMKQRGVRKTTAHTFIEVKNKEVIKENLPSKK